MNRLIFADLKRSAEPFWAGLLDWSPWHRSLPEDIQVHFWLAGLLGSYDLWPKAQSQPYDPSRTGR